MTLRLPNEREVEALYRRLHGDPMTHGWRVRMRHRFGYWTANAWYRAMIDSLVTDSSLWADVGGGKSVFPNDPDLSRELSRRCRLLVGVDPSENLKLISAACQRSRSKPRSVVPSLSLSHPEHSGGSLLAREILRSAQNDGVGISLNLGPLQGGK